MSAKAGPAPAANGKTGPQKIAAAKPLASEPQSRTKATQSAALAPVALPNTLPWARALIQAVNGPVPDYGTPEWEALPDNSRAKAVAAVLAAEAWRT